MIEEIGKYVSLQQGLAINKKSNYLVYRKSHPVDAIPLLRIQDMISNSEGDVYIDKKVSPQFLASPSDLIYTRTGQPGLVFKGKSGVVHNNCFKIKIVSDELDKEYLYQILSSDFVKKQIFSKGNSSIQLDITHQIFKSIKIPIFNLSQQRKIGRKLGLIDSKIRNNNAIINVLINKIKDAYSFYKSNISNEIKVPLSTFLKEVNENYTKSEIVPLLDLATIPSNSIICYLPENSSKLDTNKKAMKEGNILFGSIRPYLKKCIISPFDGATTGTVIQWKVKNEEMKCFILGVLLSNEFFDFAISNSTGTKMPVVKSADLLNFPVVYDKCQIDKFYSKTPVQYDLIIKLLKENYSLSKLKTDLLNKLIF